MIKNIFHPFAHGLLSMALMLPLINACSSKPAKEVYLREISEWKKNRIERLKSENGWMNLVGLLWLKEGKNNFGSDSTNDLVFPPTAPRFAGIISKQDTLLHLEVKEGVSISSEGQVITNCDLRSDASGKPTQLQMGSFSFFVIKREKQYGIRLRDMQSPLLSRLDSMPCFPVDTAYRVKARFSAFDSVQVFEVKTVINTVEKYKVPGRLEFRIGETNCTLYPFDEKDQFFLLFTDGTSARETYGGGRFLYADKPDANGNVTIDFNKAYNPPCAFTPFATCPVPPPENRLAVDIRAGEMDVHLYAH